MEGSRGQQVQAVHTVVAFVKDNGNVLAGLNQITIVGGQLLGDGQELNAVVDVAGIDRMEQRDVKVGTHD